MKHRDVTATTATKDSNTCIMMMMMMMMMMMLENTLSMTDIWGQYPTV